MQRSFWLCFVMMTLLSCSVFAAQELVLDSPAKAQTFNALIKEFRCVTCPNQSIADSQAPVASAMREDIFRRVQTGESAEDIRRYLLSRYGEYVTYRPRLKPATWFLWSGPFILLGLALLGFRSRVKAC